MPFVDRSNDAPERSSHFMVTLDLEAAALETAVRTHPALRPFFTLDFLGKTRTELLRAYLRLLKIKADYVSYTVPMLRAAAEVLRSGNADDRAWSEAFLNYAEAETDRKESSGHNAWAHNDMTALGAPVVMLSAPPHPIVAIYAKFFVEDAAQHPYAILGAKGVLERLSVRISDDLVRGVIASDVPGAAGAVSFFRHHGSLDEDHLRAGDIHLARIEDVARRSDILAGAYFTSGCYRAFLHFGI